MVKRLAIEPFGTLASGQEVHRYRIVNASGMRVSVINLGAIITEIVVPDRNGAFADVVTGFSRVAAYEAGHPFFGAIIGRVAGRLNGGRLEVDGCVYSLEVNDPPNHLHGGSDSFHTKYWDFVASGDAWLELRYISPDGENGYPGRVSVTVRYELTEQSTLEIRYSATTDQATPLSLTNHSWFNLSGEGNGSILDHELEIFANDYTPTDTAMTLLGQCVSVEGKAVDFRRKRQLGEAIPQLLNAHGDNYIFPNSSKDICAPMARLTHSASGRVLEVSSTERCLQFYGGKALDGTLIGKSGRAYQSHGALCLECQSYPDGTSHPEIEDIILRPEQRYRQTTRYAFTLMNEEPISI